jgi:peptidoglycan/LPS O-acetylase OafA/YrhL
MMQLEYKSGHMPALDGIRGLAILLVVLFHCVKTTLFPLAVICRMGWSGVDLFFVLSGFLITGILYDTKENSHFIKKFYIRRTLRIFPLYYLALMVFFLALLVPGVSAANRYLDKRLWDQWFYYLTYTQNLYVSFRGVNWLDTLNHFWSLAIEEQFYLVWPFVIAGVNKKHLAAFSFLLVFIACVLRNLYPELPFSYAFTLCRMDALAMGSFAAICIRRYPNQLNRWLPLALPIACAGLFACIGYFHSVSIDHIWFIRFGYTLLDICFALLILTVFDNKMTGKAIQAMFCFSPLRFLGKYSYGIYVYHWLLYRGVYMYLEARFQLSGIWMIPFLMLVLGISVLSFHLYEKQFLRLRERLSAT